MTDCLAESSARLEEKFIKFGVKYVAFTASQLFGPCAQKSETGWTLEGVEATVIIND